MVEMVFTLVCLTIAFVLAMKRAPVWAYAALLFGATVAASTDLIHGNFAWPQVGLLSVLGWQGSAEPVAHYATALYADDPDAEVLYRAAAGLAHAGQADAAMAWLNRAAQERPDADRLALDQGLAALHGRLDFQQLLVWSRSATPADR